MFKTCNSVSYENILQKWRRKDFLQQKLREFVASGPALEEMLKEALWREGEWYTLEISISIIKKGRLLENE